MIGQMLGWGSAILGLASNLSSGDKEIASAKSTLDTINKAYNVLNTSSVSVSAGRAIISPLVLFEQSLMHQDYMTDLMTIVNLRDIRDALTHINFQSKVGDIRIAELVDSINPNRTSGFLCYQGAEAYRPPRGSVLAQIEDGTVGQKDDQPARGRDDKEKPQDKTSFESSEFKGLGEYSPLAMGRTVNACISYDGKTTNFPLTFRQIPVPAPTAGLEKMFEAVRNGDGWSVRIKEFKAGGITWPELLNGVDEIRREFKIRTQDMTGYYKEATAREARNRVESIRTGNVSMNSLANTIIMTKETADLIEANIGITFGGSKMDQIRKSVKANTIVVVDDRRSVFTFYSMSSNLPEKYNLAGIKQKSKKEDAGSLEALIKLLNGR